MAAATSQRNQAISDKLARSTLISARQINLGFQYRHRRPHTAESYSPRHVYRLDAAEGECRGFKFSAIAALPSPVIEGQVGQARNADRDKDQIEHRMAPPNDRHARAAQQELQRFDT
jgi:hypothetical protein